MNIEYMDTGIHGYMHTWIQYKKFLTETHTKTEEPQDVNPVT